MLFGFGEFCDFCKWYTGGGGDSSDVNGVDGEKKIVLQIEWEHTHAHTSRTAIVISDKLTEKSACLPNFDYSFHILKLCV